MDITNVSPQEIQRHPAVAGARAWRDHISIDLRSRPSFQRGMPTFKGEVSTRIRLRGSCLTIERGSGATSPGWEENLIALVCWLRSRGVRVQIKRAESARLTLRGSASEARAEP
jgi:hypothetical protein